MINVRLYAHLPASSKRGQAEFTVEARAGLTVKDVLEDAGIPIGAVSIIIIDGSPGRFDSSLADNQRLALFPAVSGG